MRWGECKSASLLIFLLVSQFGRHTWHFSYALPENCMPAYFAKAYYGVLIYVCMCMCLPASLLWSRTTLKRDLRNELGIICNIGRTPSRPVFHFFHQIQSTIQVCDIKLYLFYTAHKLRNIYSDQSGRLKYLSLYYQYSIIFCWNFWKAP